MFIIMKTNQFLLGFLYKIDLRISTIYAISPFKDIQYFYRSWKVYFLAHSTQILNNLMQSRFKHLYVTYFYQTITLRDVTQNGFPLKLIASTWEEVFCQILDVGGSFLPNIGRGRKFSAKYWTWEEVWRFFKFHYNSFWKI